MHDLRVDLIADERDLDFRVAELQFAPIAIESHVDAGDVALADPQTRDVELLAAEVAPHVDVAERSGEEPDQHGALILAQLELRPIVLGVRRREQELVRRFPEPLEEFEADELEPREFQVPTEGLEPHVRPVRDLHARVVHDVLDAIRPAVALRIETRRFGILLLRVALGLVFLPAFEVRRNARRFASGENVALGAEELRLHYHFDEPVDDVHSVLLPIALGESLPFWLCPSWKQHRS